MKPRWSELTKRFPSVLHRLTRSKGSKAKGKPGRVKKDFNGLIERKRTTITKGVGLERKSGVTEKERGRRRTEQKGNSRTKREESGQETVRSRIKGWDGEREDRDEAISGQKGPKAKNGDERWKLRETRRRTKGKPGITIRIGREK